MSKKNNKNEVTSALKPGKDLTLDELNMLIDSVYNGIVSIDENKRVRIFNKSAEHIFEMDRNNIIGKPYEDVFPDGPLAEILQSGSIENNRKLEYKGKILLSNRTPVIDKNNKIKGAVGVVQDISNLENMNRILNDALQTNEQLNAVLKKSLDSLFITDAEGKVLSVNEAYTKITGIKAEDILGKTLYELVEKGLYKRAAALMVIESHEPVSYTEKTKTGRTAVFVGTPIFNQEGDLVNVLVNIHDVTELESVSNELADTKALKDELDAVIQASFDGIIVTDNNGIVLSMNDAYQRITGLNREELVGRNMFELTQAGVYDHSDVVMVIESKKSVTLTQKLTSGKSILVTGNPIFNESGELVRIITNARDLTELDRLRQEVEHANHLRRHYENELNKIIMEDSFIAQATSSQQLQELIARVSKVDSTILIQGESGVGKEVVARELHYQSPRRDKPYIKINCAAIPESLLESELFGYEKGAFTGARKEGKMGIFELANNGSLFLDEVGDIPLHLQVKLLRVLQENEVTRVGGDLPIKIDVRVIAATNRNLREMIKAKQFREDLYYRLNVVPIMVSPLRERKEEIEPLIIHFLGMFNKKYNLNKTIDPQLIKVMQDYDWPGNIRELRNVIERAVVTSPDAIIQGINFPGSEEHLFSNVINELPSISLKSEVEAYEKELLKKYIDKYGSSRKAASVLGTSQTTIWRKANQYGIHLQDN
ncbi:MAG: putative sigma54 specific transcriptional regulator [Firmicutes bacterium]|nr:putative sigma54 specific transcriptional regulator [Bacillota bacterium]